MKFYITLKLKSENSNKFLKYAYFNFKTIYIFFIGNEFTTLAGVEFLWSIDNADKHTSDSKIPNDVLRFMTYQESQYETPTTVAALDATGKKGHIVLLEGIKTGTAKVLTYFIY